MLLKRNINIINKKFAFKLKNIKLIRSACFVSSFTKQSGQLFKKKASGRRVVKISDMYFISLAPGSDSFILK